MINTTRAMKKYRLAALSLIVAVMITSCSAGGAATLAPIAATTNTEASSPTTSPAVESQTTQPAERLSVNLPQAVSTSDLEASIIGVYKRANPAVVYIIVPSVGSGFVYSSEGYIVTNRHVVESGRNFEVMFSSGDRQHADLIGSDVDSDLAVLKSINCRPASSRCPGRLR